MDRIFLVHLSDVHIGSSAYHNPIWSSAANFVANGHDNLLIDELMLLWDKRQRQLRRMLSPPGQSPPQDDLHVLVSGDLTRTGSFHDFDLSWDFLSNAWAPPGYTVPAGAAIAGLQLNVQSPNLPAVPGNHDQWSGANWWLGVPGFNPAGFTRRFGRTNWQIPVTINDGALNVEVYGVDSNSGLQGMALSPRQRGAIAIGELNALERQLQQTGLPSRQTVRIVLCHHGFDHVGSQLRPLDPGSRDELLRIASDHEISAVLTGHSHYVNLSTWQTTLPTQAPVPRSVWEIRSTTPVAGPASPSGSTTAAAFPGNQTVCHGFFVHEITLASPYDIPGWKVHAILLVGGSFAYCGSSNIPI